MTVDLSLIAHPYEAVRMITPEALLQDMRSNVPLVVVDVREPTEIRATGTIPGARTFPVPQLAVRLADLAQHHCTRVVVVSGRGRRGRTAAVALEAAGFTEVFLLDGGMRRWMDLGYPLEERRDSTPSLSSS